MTTQRGDAPTWLADFEQLEREDLLALWTKAYGSPPFKAHSARPFYEGSAMPNR